MSLTDKPIRVFQVATGNVGSEMIKRIADQPDLELIGVHCYSPEKIGKDAGELAGLAPNGVKATGTVEEIIAAKPDVLTFHGVFPDEDLYVKVLEAGIDIVTTADWITGWHRDTNHPHPSGKPVSQLLAEACDEGRLDLLRNGHESRLESDSRCGLFGRRRRDRERHDDRVRRCVLSSQQGHLDRGRLRSARR